MAFTAGTGILVFMDLVMRIYLTLLGALPKEQMLHPEFRFVLYASFQNKDEASGLELAEKLNDICLQFGYNNFELFMRMNGKNRVGKPQRWNDKFIRS